METTAKLVILGIGDDGSAGLTEASRRILQEASLLLGAASTLDLVPVGGATRVALDPEMTAALRQVREALASPRPVLVCSGDPLFYGIARYLCDRLGKERFEIVPHVSSMQLAFARVKESWDDAHLLSLAGRPLEAIVSRLRTAEKAGLFPSDDVPPARLARALLDRGIRHFRAYVCENLGSPDERVTQAELAELAQLDFDPLNVLILIRKADAPEPGAPGRRRRFGNPDELFQQNQPRRAAVTQAEVRALAIAQLDIRPGAVVWDIGAGSGSFAIEAARLAAPGIVFAVEPRAEDLALIAANAESFDAPNVRPIGGRAPEILAGLPDPDAVFIGGTGRHVGTILRAALDRIKPTGRLAVNVATIEALVESHRTLRGLAEDVQLWNVAVSRGIEQLDRVRFQAINPTFLLAATKPERA